MKLLHFRKMGHWLTVCGMVAVSAGLGWAQKVQLPDGRILPGRMLYVPGVAKIPVELQPDEAPTQSTPILLIHDDLRRVFVPKQGAQIVDLAPEPLVKIKLWQNVSQAGSTLGSVGPSLGITPFDAYGRRIYRMRTKDGPLAIVQGITELTPRYAKVEGLRGQPRSPVWDMRLATSSIPRDTLARILAQAVSQENAQDWLQVVRFYLQAERYSDARAELAAIIQRFPEMQELSAQAHELKQMAARRVLQEIQLRQTVGQHQLVATLLQNFPLENVAGETLQQVRELNAECAARGARLAAVKEQLQALAEKITDADHRRLIDPLVQEILTDLSPHSLPRLIPLLQLADDASLAVEAKVALATSGWVLGAAGATQELAEAIAWLRVREQVRRYLLEPLAHQRLVLLESIRSAAGDSVPQVARLLAHLTPPWEIPAEAADGYGAYTLTAPGQSENGDFRYYVQLPPEYDPYRRYPLLVVLNGAHNSPLQELEFWTGPPACDAAGAIVGPRRGQAMRHGYVTLAVQWQQPQQYRYEYTLREHEAVLTALRDATRRLSIDTNRVFLSGHDIGGDAAWDLALAHPDLWAGALPFTARYSPVKKYVQHYWENAAYVPLYFVAGEKDGNKMVANAPVLDKYFRRRFDVTVVEFLGRGQESFHDEILEALTWMQLPTHRRQASPAEFRCMTMRPWDNFFWWIEGRDFPRSVHPASWPQRQARPTSVEGRVLKKNHLAADSGAAHTTLWLSPELVDFSQPIKLTWNGRKLSKLAASTEPSLEVLLEDVRTRGDRLRPFWAKVQVP